MANRIFKYALSLEDTAMRLPSNAYSLSVQYQGRDLVMWCLVDDEESTRVRQIRIAGTGHALDFDVSLYRYAGTAIDPYNDLVWHVFVEA